MFQVKKAVLIGMAAVLFVGGGAALAVNSTPQDVEDMAPYMQEKYPHMTDEEMEYYYGENGMHRRSYWDDESERREMHRDRYWDDENERRGMHRDRYWDDENERRGMHRGPYWDDDERGNGAMYRGEYPGYGKGRYMMSKPGPGSGAEQKESK
jgi:hypothetical protein